MTKVIIYRPEGESDLVRAAVLEALVSGSARVVLLLCEEGHPPAVEQRPELMSLRATSSDGAVMPTVESYRDGYADGYVDCLTIMRSRRGAGDANSPTSPL